VLYVTAMPGVPYYAEAFSPYPAAASAWSPTTARPAPTQCPNPVGWRGSWRAPNGRRYRIEACEGHWPRAAAPLLSLAAGRRGGRRDAGTPGRLATRPYRPRARSNPHTPSKASSSASRGSIWRAVSSLVRSCAQRSGYSALSEPGIRAGCHGSLRDSPPAVTRWILRYWLDSAPHLSCADSTQAYCVDVEHQPTDLAVGFESLAARQTRSSEASSKRSSVGRHLAVSVLDCY
jgi:hypothetical protein